MDLVKMVAERVGCDEATAKSALGIILKLCKSQFGDEKFNQIAQYVPGLEDMMKSAPDAGGGAGGMLGAVTSMFGGGGKDGGGIAGVAGAISGFSQLNLGADDAQKTVDVLQEHVQEQGAEQAGGLLQGLLG